VSLLKQFLSMSGVAILAYLALAHFTGAEGIINSLASGTEGVYSTLQGRGA
jgi:hypothetical protein